MGDVIPLGVAVAMSPVPVIAALLILLAPVGVRGGSLFLAARMGSFAVLTALFAGGSDLADDAAESTTPAAVVRLLIGTALVVGAVVTWRRRARGDDEPELPGWMHTIDGMGPAATFRFGVVFTVANPKEIAFAAGAGFTIGGAMLGVGDMVAAGAVFVVIACLSVVVPVVAVLVGGARLAPALTATRAWLVRHISVVITIVMLALGAILINSGITTLL